MAEIWKKGKYENCIWQDSGLLVIMFLNIDPEQEIHGNSERSVERMEKKKKKLPIGIEYFEKLRSEDFYYIDKTGGFPLTFI